MENGNLIWWVFCFCDFSAFRKIGYGGRVGRGGKSGVHLMFFPFLLSTERGKKKNQFWVHRYAHFKKFYDQNRKERIFAFNQCDWGSMSIIWDGKNAIFFFFLMVSLGYG